MATEHPKVTAYIPKEIVKALDEWKGKNEIESRSAAIVAILADYLGVQHPVQPQGTAPGGTMLSTVLAELRQLQERVAALEQTAVNTAPQEAPSTALASPPELSSSVLKSAPSTVLVSNALNNTASTVASVNPPLTQSALAKRLSCSDKAVEKHRRQGNKENFAAWSRDRDPDGISWTWEGAGGRGQPLRFVQLGSGS